MLAAFILQPSFAWSQEDDPLKAIDALTYARDNEFDDSIIAALDPGNDSIIACGTEVCDISKRNCWKEEELS